MRTYKWRPDKPDHRDYTFAEHFAVTPNLPKLVDLRPLFPAPYDQGNLGSCTGNALAGAMQYMHIKLLKDGTAFSRLFIYYNERRIEHTVRSDSGAEIRDGIKSLATYGVCSEDEWPYIISKFKRTPLKKVYTSALKNKIGSYYRITDLASALQCLADGYPFTFGFSVYENIDSPEVARTGILGLPSKTDKMEGGHAVLCVGYDLEKRVFIIRNSWGTDWGMGGYFTMPFNYVMNPNLADDFWTIRK